MGETVPPHTSIGVGPPTTYFIVAVRNLQRFYGQRFCGILVDFVFRLVSYHYILFCWAAEANAFVLNVLVAQSGRESEARKGYAVGLHVDDTLGIEPVISYPTFRPIKFISHQARPHKYISVSCAKMRFCSVSICCSGLTSQSCVPCQFQMDESLSDTYGYSECSGKPSCNVSCDMPGSCKSLVYTY